MASNLDFIIIGGMKCGTTSMYNYLVQHPDVASQYEKESFFFSRYYDKGIAWYTEQLSKKNGQILGDGSTDYFHFPEVPKRIKEAFPHIKLIAICTPPSVFCHLSTLSYFLFSVFSFPSPLHRHAVSPFPPFGRKPLPGSS